MNIRNKITLRFILIVAFIIFTASLLIYIFSADYREEEFYSRLYTKAHNTAKLLIEVDEVDATVLKRIEQANPVALHNERVIIFDYRNQTLFSTDEDRVIEIDSALLDRVRLEEDVRFRQGTFEVLGFLFKGQYDRFVVIAAATDIYGFNKLKNLRNVLFTVCIVSIVVVSVSGWFFAGKALQPISKVVQQVDDISITSMDLRVAGGNGKDEIAHLAQTFNRMLDRLEGSFNLQKEFIANASHELRTPLTAITGQLEVSLLHRRSSVEYERVMLSILEDIKSLNTLSNRLLLLAQTNVGRIDGKMSMVRIDEQIWQAREELIKHNPAYKIRIDFDHQLDEESKLTIEGDEQLIKVAFLNLIDNGCKYSPNHTIDVRITLNRFGLVVSFEDSGIGIPKEDMERIFEPFHRGSNTQKIKGHGIGLSMVKRVITAHQGVIQINSEVGKGTVVTIHFQPPVKN
jgi:signal transduction histidine kinase